MNKEEVITILKKRMVDICRDCDEENIRKGTHLADIDICFNCKVHKLVNDVVAVINGN